MLLYMVPFCPAFTLLNHLFKFNSALSRFDIVLLIGGISCISILIMANITVPIYANTRLNATFMIIIAMAINSIQAINSTNTNDHKK